MSSNTNQQQGQMLYSQYQTAVQQLQVIESQLNQIAAVIDELTHNVNTINGLKDNSETKEVILPLGGLLFIKANLSGSDEVLINVGSETIVPTTFETALKMLSERLNEMNEAFKKLSEDRDKLADIASQLEHQLNQISKMG